MSENLTAKLISELYLYNNLGLNDFFYDKPRNRMEVQKNFEKQPNPSHNNTDIMTLLENCNDLHTLRQLVESFDKCELRKTAKNTVFSDGNPEADIMLIGEAPGANEDEQGIPFCGQSGKLLDNILLAIGLDRKKVYITNTVFWRPPNNRRPTQDELLLCCPFVEKHISLVLPKLILLVGSTAVESLLQSNVPITKLRGNYFEYTNPYLQNTIKTTAIFHPSYLLRQPDRKKLMWFDILKIKHDMKIDGSGKVG